MSETFFQYFDKNNWYGVMTTLLPVFATFLICISVVHSQWSFGLAPGVTYGELDGSLSYIPWFDSSRTVTFGNTESSSASMLLRATARYTLSLDWSVECDLGYNRITGMLSTMPIYSDTFKIVGSKVDSMLIQKTQPRALSDVKMVYVVLTAQCLVYKQLRLGAGMLIGNSTTSVHGAGDYDLTDGTPRIKTITNFIHPLYYLTGSGVEETHSALSLGAIVRLSYRWELSKIVSIIPCVEYNYSFLRAIPSSSMRLQTLSYLFTFERSF